MPHGKARRQSDYYAILNLPSESSLKDVQEQYRRLVKVFHPDINSGDKWFEDQLKLINEAYEVLSNPDRKARYDSIRRYRTDDPDPFEKPFESTPEPENKSADWTFTPPPEPLRRDVPTMQTQVNWSTGAQGSPSVVMPLRRGSSGEERRRANRLRAMIGIAAAAAIIIMVIVIKQQPDDDVIPKSVQHMSATIDPGATYADSIPSSGYVARELQPLTGQEIQAADKVRHSDAIRRRTLVAPYWARYQAVEPRAKNLADLGQSLLEQMQGQDDDSGRILTADNVRFQAEQKLSNDVKSMHIKLDMMQSQFDDLQYGDSVDGASTLSQLDSELKDLESTTDPLYQDLKH